jgi:hypothetical protein
MPTMDRLAANGLTYSQWHDGGDSVSPSYPNKFEFTGGTIKQVVFDVSDDTYHDTETYLASLMVRD